MLSISYHPLELPLLYPLPLDGNRQDTQSILLVRLSSPTGRKGYGEVSVVPNDGQELEGMISRLQHYEAGISTHALIDPQRFHHYLHHLMGEDPFLISALDMAAWDLFAKIQRKPLYQLFRLAHQHGIRSSFTIGNGPLEEMKERISTHPWPLYQIDLHHADDLDLLRQLRQETRSAFRVDAQASLEVEDALRLLPEFKKLGVELLEQPLDREAWEEMGRLKSRKILPLIADESFETADDLGACQRFFDGVHIKIPKVGGISPSMHLIAEARRMNLKLLISSFCSSSLGTAAAIPFLNLADYACLDGPLLLTKDIGTGLYYNEAQPMVDSQGIGLGVTLNPDLFPPEF